jgi:hypothetical protein
MTSEDYQRGAEIMAELNREREHTDWSIFHAAGCAVLVTASLLLFAWVGYQGGKQRTRELAVANGAATYVTTENGPEFRWLEHEEPHDEN